MTGYVARRLLQSIPVLIFVSIAVFGLLPLVGGDPAYTLLGPDAAPEQYAQVRQDLGLDRPLYEQYWRWASQALRGNLGTTILPTHFAVVDVLKQRLPITAELGVLAILIGVLTGIPIGIFAAARRRSWLDFWLMNVSLVGIVTPSFVLGLLFVFVFSLWLRVLPSQGYKPFLDDPIQNLRLMVLPALTLGLGFGAIIARYTRANVIDAIEQPYITTARAKGLNEPQVLTRHAVKPALIPVVTVVGLQLSVILGGAVIIETLFNLPGIGKLIIDSIYLHDFPVVQGAILMLSAGFVTINLFVDLLYGVLDPRVRRG